MAQQKSVTLVISHVLDPEHGQQYEAWLGKIMPIAAEFPGHLGANVIRPAPGQNLWSVIIRFDTIEHLYAWTQSETRRQLVAEIAPLLSEGDRTEVRTEPAFWFTPPAANVRQPRRWKQFLITLLVIFPSTNLVPSITGILLPSLKGSLLLHLINDACVVALVVWFWMPIVTHLFAGWLKKN
ncbi:antibiotic biosynthesis monooxygenase [Klebsiella michiganensis]|mgnify:FL=1|uniref:Antibiotic biosynthesis monooxygenase n=1 Tax=Klebsiella michiganensis TaxID=1134687 RepID=A0AAX3CMT2_9ENTR|nr:antibiotic biosynthesis monooxygenase [Klebsiella michiganensis]QLW91176.1 antibiotic biosynthesis monooxygenase [Klebsiella oxytoca]MBX8652798.1 antibiotic biosynthesis monooxygenase [Klebsiella michiganensis]MBZ7146954.1 antibiotic biosynthesis monooxygenase [Klebsiella michiganensis]MBZ7486970.1 antibiotic biosynthesis monooxygenase [Klebsiella michiganensis]MBZ7597851.1 antibiotic biosynthesis monooxygenase [Klebsiella michiganensis]